MIHSVPDVDRVTRWALTSRGYDRLRQATAAVLRGAQRLRELGNHTPELRMSRGWLEEHERQSRKRPGG